MKATQLGRYHLLDRIAFGGMAEIYRAKTFDEQGRVQMVAVKRILSHLARDEEFIKMLVDEARIASLMEHEGIAKVYEFCHAQGEYFIAMEYVDGKDGRTILDRCRARRRWIPAEICAFIMMKVLRALHCAHIQTDRRGRALDLIHRDVSPSNVICSYSGEVKLCDFGIAKATLSQVQTRSGVIKGKVKYMSPEQALGRKLDPRSDIFSAGSVLYELLTRVPPFLAPNEMELLVLVRETRYSAVRELNPMVPPALEAIVDTAMSRRRQDRYQSAAEFADALQEYLSIHAPDLSRSHLGQFVRQLFADEIDRELRSLEDYIVEDSAVEEVGVNLIADALGPEAEFSRFSPQPGVQAGLEDLTPQDPRRGEIEVAGGDVRVAADSAQDPQPGVILGEADMDPYAREPSTEIIWQRADGPLASAPHPASDGLAPPEAGPPPGEAGVRPGPSPDLHDAQTAILDIEDPPPADRWPEDSARAQGDGIGGAGGTHQEATSGQAEVDAEGDPTSLAIHDMETGEIEQTGQEQLPGLEDEPGGEDAHRESSQADLVGYEVGDRTDRIEALEPAFPRERAGALPRSEENDDITSGGPRAASPSVEEDLAGGAEGHEEESQSARDDSARRIDTPGDSDRGS